MSRRDSNPEDTGSRKRPGGCRTAHRKLYLARDQPEKNPMGSFIVAACLEDLYANGASGVGS